MTTIYLIKKYLKDLDGSPNVYVGHTKYAYRNKDKAIERKDELNQKSYNYVYKVYGMELI